MEVKALLGERGKGRYIMSRYNTIIKGIPEMRTPLLIYPTGVQNRSNRGVPL